MPSVIRNKKTGHVCAPGTKAWKERHEKQEREEAKQAEFWGDLDSGRLSYGRRMPIQEKDE